MGDDVAHADPADRRERLVTGLAGLVLYTTYRLSQGKLSQVSVDHSEVQELVDAGQISQAQAAVHPRRHVVTRALGTGDEIEVHLGCLDAPSQLKPTYELWVIRREDWLPPFDVARRYQQDREGKGRSEPWSRSLRGRQDPPPRRAAEARARRSRSP